MTSSPDPTQGDAAPVAALPSWADRRRSEGDAAGVTAARARQQIAAAFAAGDAAMVRAATHAYEVLVAQAELLSSAEGTERKESLLDELARRRAERTA